MLTTPIKSHEKSGKSSFLGKHLSHSASELSYRGVALDSSPTRSPQRTRRSTANPSVAGVLSRTHGFFSSLRVNIFRKALQCSFCRSSSLVLKFKRDPFTAVNCSKSLCVSSLVHCNLFHISRAACLAVEAANEVGTRQPRAAMPSWSIRIALIMQQITVQTTAAPLSQHL